MIEIFNHDNKPFKVTGLAPSERVIVWDVKALETKSGKLKYEFTGNFDYVPTKE